MVTFWIEVIAGFSAIIGASLLFGWYVNRPKKAESKR